MVTGLALLVAMRWSDYDVEVGLVAFGSGVAFVMLAASRGAYAAWLRHSRASGRFCRQVIIVGTDDEGSELCELMQQHPETGYRVVGVVGRRQPTPTSPSFVPWLGDLDEIVGAVERTGVNAVFIATGDIGSRDLNTVARELVDRGVHVHVSSGLRGVDHRRLRNLPLAHEPFYYLEPACLSRWQRSCKRALDITVAGGAGIVLSPILVAAGIAVKLGDRGPVLFRQTRIGRDGRPFTVLKLRTMVPDAETQLVDLMRLNQRAGGPLFKAAKDPRRTRVGRVLERTSLDELPQLWNVLRGDMSLVGPRPALPREVENFDPVFLDRHRVLPGITGLWQVEGRDNPAFEVYRRLDLFYVENWSVGLDLAIMLRTVATVLGRPVRSFRNRRHPSPSMTLTIPEMAIADLDTITLPAQESEPLGTAP